MDGGRGPRLLALIKKPFETLVVFTLIVGVWFVVAGVVILPGPDLSLATLAVIIGTVLIVRGGLLIAAGRQLRALDRAPETDPVAGAVA